MRHAWERIKGELDPYLRQPKQAPTCSDPPVFFTGGSIDLSSDVSWLKTPGFRPSRANSSACKGECLRYPGEPASGS